MKDRRVFKGRWYYETQVGPLIFGWLHDLSHKPSRNRRKLRIGRFQVWYDTAWKSAVRLRYLGKL